MKAKEMVLWYIEHGCTPEALANLVQQELYKFITTLMEQRNATSSNAMFGIFHQAHTKWNTFVNLYNDLDGDYILTDDSFITLLEYGLIDLPDLTHLSVIDGYRSYLLSHPVKQVKINSHTDKRIFKLNNHFPTPSIPLCLQNSNS